MQRLLMVSIGALCLFVEPGQLWAHGRMTGTASVSLSTQRLGPLERRYTFRLADATSGKPIMGAAVEVEARREFTSGRGGRSFRAIQQTEPGAYVVKVDFSAPGYWLLEARVTGPVTGKVKFADGIEAQPPPRDPGQPSIQFRGLDFYQPLSLTLANISVLALHVLASVGLIAGLALKILLEGPIAHPRGVSGDDWGLKRWSFLIHTALGALIATGFYNLWYNVPGRLEELAVMEYGGAYLTVTAVKFIAFGLLLLALVFSVRRWIGLALATVALVGGVILGHLHILIHLTP
ncbi:MAG: hypothetical protein HYS14_03160 [Candidatus Rokubacteria bacterium]|nr:hypothetical protein [Candidatus Rokubacteria bacterium]